MENILSLPQMVLDRIKATAEPVNLEDRYCEMLDENYSDCHFFNDYHLTPSSVIKKVDPIAFNEGLSNYGDNCDDFVEIDGKWYDRYEVSHIKAEIIEEIDNMF